MTHQAATLAEELAPELLRYFTRRTRHAEDAADLLGETLLVLARRKGDIPEHPREARMWCFGIARTVLLGHFTRAKRHLDLIERLRSELRRSGPDAALDPVPDALATLDEMDQEIIRLLHWEGFTQVEIASHLSLPAGTVRSRYSRARARLHELLAPTVR